MIFLNYIDVFENDFLSNSHCTCTIGSIWFVFLKSRLYIKILNNKQNTMYLVTPFSLQFTAMRLVTRLQYIINACLFGNITEASRLIKF